MLTSKPNFGPTYQLKLVQSSSKNKTFQHCSQKYYCSYHLKLPELQNAGSAKGSVVHDVLELIGIPRRKSLVEKIIVAQTCREFPSVWSLVEKYAKQNKVFQEEELEMIDGFILVALQNKFYGPPGTVEILIEKSFDLEVIDGTRRYRIRGFIDRTYIVKDGNRMKVFCTDFKSSKKAFNASELQDSMQAQTYELALSYMYPNYEIESIDFIFLKFPKDPIRTSPKLGRAALYGFELFLTEIQTRLENFSEKNIGDNLGILKFETKFLCGPAKSGWICPAQRPMNYAVLLNQEGEILASGFTKEELGLKLKDGLRIEERFYSGCIHFHDREGKPRRVSYE